MNIDCFECPEDTIIKDKQYSSIWNYDDATLTSKISEKREMK